MTPNPDHYKINRYWDFEGANHPPEEIPETLNYVGGLGVRLHKIPVWRKGDIVELGLFSSAEKNVHGELVGSDLIVKETFDYTQGLLGPESRVQTICWIREDDSQGGTKERPKLYSASESRIAGRRRRRNVIDHMTTKVVGLLVHTETSGDVAGAISLGQSYLAGLESLVAEYIEASTSGLAGAILGESQKPWLNNPINAEGVTIRQFILDELS